MHTTPRLASCSSTLCLERSRRTRTATTWPEHSSRSHRSQARRRKPGANDGHRGGNPSSRRPFQSMIDGKCTKSLVTLVHHTTLYHQHHNNQHCKPNQFFPSYRSLTQLIQKLWKTPHIHITPIVWSSSWTVQVPLHHVLLPFLSSSVSLDSYSLRVNRDLIERDGSHCIT